MLLSSNVISITSSFKLIDFMSFNILQFIFPKIGISKIGGGEEKSHIILMRLFIIKFDSIITSYSLKIIKSRILSELHSSNIRK